MSTNSNQNYLNKVLSIGLIGTTSVTIQTISLVWTNKILKKQKQYNLSLFQSAVNVYKKGGIRQFFKGSFSPYVYNSFARFGDLTSNFLVLNFFQKNTVFCHIPLFLQTVGSWGLASLWRIAITPLAVLSNPQNLKQFKKMNPKYRMVRTYSKFVKPEIKSLYSWFLIQNYLIQYTQQIKYSQNSMMAFLRFSLFGFLSMISYDIYLNFKNSLQPPKLPSRYWFNRVFIRGLHGVIFCNSSQFIKEKIESQE